MTVRVMQIKLPDGIENYIFDLPHALSSVVKSNKGGWQSELLDYQSLDWMQPILDQVRMAAGCDELTYWVNINSESDYNEWHDHDRGTGGELCGCLYITTPLYCGRFAYKQNNEIYHIDPTPGTLIIFPDNLQHSVEPSQSGQKRVSIAFNFWRMLPKYK